MPDRYVKYVITCDSTGAITGMKRVEEGAKSLSGRLQETGSRMKSVGSGMTSFGHKLSSLSLPLLAIGGYAVKSAIDFQTSMTMLQTQAGASAREVKGLESAVLKMSPNVSQGPKELAEALYPIRSVGLTGSKALQALDASAKGADISGAGLTETADALSGALRTNMKDISSASGAMDVMNKIVGLGKLHLTDLNEAFATGILPAAKVAGLGFRDVGAALDAMTRQGIPASVEATRLRTNLSQFEAPRGSALKALKSIGLGQYALAEDLRKPSGLIVALKDLQSHLSRVGQNEQGNVLARAFGGARGSANVAGLLNALPSMTGIREQLGGAGAGQFAQAFATKAQTAGFKVAAAIAAGKAALVQLGQTLIPIVIPALTKFSKLVIGGIEWLKRLPKPVKDVIVGFTILLAVGGPLLIFFGNLTSAMGSLLTVFGKFGGAASTAAAGESGAFAAAGTTLGSAFSVAFRAALPIAALAVFLDVLSKIHPSASHGGEAMGHGWSGARKGNKSLLGLAASATPWAPNGTIGEAGLTPAEERAQLQLYYRKAIPYGVISPALAGQGESPAEKASAARLAEQVANHLAAHPILVQSNLTLDGALMAHSTATHARNNPAVAKKLAEATTKYAQHRAARP